MSFNKKTKVFPEKRGSSEQQVKARQPGKLVGVGAEGFEIWAWIWYIFPLGL